MLVSQHIMDINQYLLIALCEVWIQTYLRNLDFIIM